MKVMSIRTTLSLQVHPTKEQAARLHDKDPLHYPDRNHKPELAYALTRFELLCGFRPAHEFRQNLKAFVPLRQLLGEENVKKLEHAIDTEIDPHSDSCRIHLAQCFRQMMIIGRDRPEVVEELLEQLMISLDNGVRGALIEETVGVIRKMSVDFPGDVGIFSPLLLNHLILLPGECCYYAAEELHAYLSGECVECVGCSNNTIRAAMTPKFIDRDALCEVLNYKMTEPEYYMVPATELEGFPCVDQYAPDCKDFQLHKMIVNDTVKNTDIPSLECASIMVIVRGGGILEDLGVVASSSNSTNNLSTMSAKKSISRGDIIYIPPGRRLRFTNVSQEVEAYRTFSYEIGPDHENRKIVVTEPIRPQFDVTDSESGIFDADNDSA